MILAASPSDKTIREHSGSRESTSSVARKADFAINQPQQPSEHDRPCVKGEEDRNSDLCAQWKAADAAADSADWAARTFHFSIIGMILGGITMGAAIAAALYAREAARETKRAATAAEASVIESVRIGEAQVRGYVVVSKIHVKRKENKLEIYFTISNKGQSPIWLDEISCSTMGKDDIEHLQEIEHIENIAGGGEGFMTPFFFNIPRKYSDTIVFFLRARSIDVFGRIGKFSAGYAGPETWVDDVAESFSPLRHVAAALKANETEAKQSR